MNQLENSHPILREMSMVEMSEKVNEARIVAKESTKSLVVVIYETMPWLSPSEKEFLHTCLVNAYLNGKIDGLNNHLPS